MAEMAQTGMVAHEDAGQELLTLYLENARKDVAALETASGEAAANPDQWVDLSQRMRSVVHNVKGQGASFGYPLMTRVGESLSVLLKHARTPDPTVLKLTAAHIETLRTILDKDIKGSGGELGETLAFRLESLVDKLA